MAHSPRAPLPPGRTSAAHLAVLAERPPTHIQATCVQRSVGATPVYRLHDRWSLNLYGFRGHVLVGDLLDRHVVHAGVISLLPPGTQRQFLIAQPGPHWAIHFSPAQATQSEGIIWLDVGTKRSWLVELVDSVIKAETPERQQAVLWHVLWEVAKLPAEGDESGSHLAEVALAFIRQHFADRNLSVADLARRCGCSHNHLTRMVRERYGTTVVGAIRSERMARAQYLLRHSDLSLAHIAAEVGIPDAQRFNKVVREHFGAAPRSIRQQRGG